LGHLQAPFWATGLTPRQDTGGGFKVHQTPV